jgi:small subunit ribosomal protein S2
VDYVIPGNDDALRAIRLFASKIADSAVEGVQLAKDVQSQELATAAGMASEAEAAAAGEAPAEGVTADISASEEGAGEDISMEDVLGTGTRKQPAKEEREEREVSHAESQF